MKTRHKVAIGFIVFTFFALILDYSTYVHDSRWYSQIKEDLPVGTHIDQARTYLNEQKDKHNIDGLRENFEADIRGFAFYNRNNSLITMAIRDGIDSLMFGYVVIFFDENDRLREINTLK